MGASTSADPQIRRIIARKFHNCKLQWTWIVHLRGLSLVNLRPKVRAKYESAELRWRHGEIGKGGKGSVWIGRSSVASRRAVDTIRGAFFGITVLSCAVEIAPKLKKKFQETSQTVKHVGHTMLYIGHWRVRSKRQLQTAFVRISLQEASQPRNRK
jgi:hypothetical protein